MILDSSEIVDIVCSYYEIDKYKMFSNTRKREIIFPRQVCYHFCRLYTKLSFERIGKIRTYFTNLKSQDHATVLHAYNVVNDIYDSDRNFRNKYNDIEQELKKQYSNTTFSKVVPNKVDLLEICIRNSQSLKNYIAA